MHSDLEQSKARVNTFRKASTDNIFGSRQLKKHIMELRNSTLGSGFILVGILNDSGSPELLCATFTILYMLALTSNGLLLLAITIEAQLHMPMYLLLGQLSLMDLLFTSVVTPKALADFLRRENTISFGGCALQMFLALTMGGAEDLLLAFMAYDRYVAICHPLTYMTLVSPRVCWIMVATSWILASLIAIGHTMYTMHLPFCVSWEIRHLLCEIPPLLKLACADTSRYELIIYVTGVTFLLLPISAIVASYTLVLFTVLRMPSNEGRKKALVTCSSHLIVVGMFYGAATFMYVLPSSFHSPKQDNIISVFYTIVTPALNPLIYSLRNKEVMGALRRVLGKYILLAHSTL
ncbi:olfactory receptor 2AG2 [Pan troglodytes]|nr:olfactory receptor 2AG2 [Pan troglodytes]